MRTIDIIAGARPNFMKISPIIRVIEERKNTASCLDYRLVHTGQHYDDRMSGSFFEQLNIPQPHVNLEVRASSQIEQTAAIMIAYEKLLNRERSDLCLVVGDVTSTMACAIAAQKSSIPVAHVEAGIRSGDWGMPEEINRIVTDAISNYFFTTSRMASENLMRSGVEASRVYFVGNTMIDTLLANVERLSAPDLWFDLGLKPGGYFVITIHRPSNVDNIGHLSDLLHTIGAASQGIPSIFPVHPRTERSIEFLSNLPSNIKLVKPQAYLQFNYLVRHAKAIITDSGGVTEEATVMDVPCITLRNSTERPETVMVGTNELVGTNPDAIKAAIEKVLSGLWKKGKIPELWDGQAGRRIVEVLEQIL